MGFVILATAGYDHIVRFWDAQSGKCYRAIQHKESVRTLHAEFNYNIVNFTKLVQQINKLEISPDKKYIAAAANPSIKFYEVRSNNPNAALSFSGHTGNVTSIGFQKDGKWIFTASEDNTIKLWDMSGAGVFQQEYKFSGAVTSSALHPNQAEIVCGFQDGSLKVIDLVANKIFRILGPDPESSIRAVAVSPNGKWMTCCNSAGMCYIWEISHNSCKELSAVAKIPAHDTYILSAVFSPNSSLLATTSADQTIKIWNLSSSTITKERTLIGHQQWVWDAAWSADSAFLLSGASDKTARLWDVTQGEAVRQYTGHAKPVSAVALNDAVDSLSTTSPRND